MTFGHASNTIVGSTVRHDDVQRLAYIDCLRGYAVLLVITSHLTYAYPNLPYPVHRLTVLGWYGVQLFFLASAITLMMSWNAEVIRYGRGDAPSFFLRRFFRITPAYYAAALLYYFVTSPPGGCGPGSSGRLARVPK
jgi:peptidoglycan/LPS O-acetylase OafA/YrhL